MAPFSPDVLNPAAPALQYTDAPFLSSRSTLPPLERDIYTVCPPLDRRPFCLFFAGQRHLRHLHHRRHYRNHHPPITPTAPWRTPVNHPLPLGPLQEQLLTKRKKKETTKIKCPPTAPSSQTCWSPSEPTTRPPKPLPTTTPHHRPPRPRALRHNPPRRPPRPQHLPPQLQQLQQLTRAPMRRTSHQPSRAHGDDEAAAAPQRALSNRRRGKSGGLEAGTRMGRKDFIVCSQCRNPSIRLSPPDKKQK